MTLTPDKNKLVIEGMVEENKVGLCSKNTAEIVTLSFEISRDPNAAKDPLKTFSTGKVVRITIEEI